jgi:5-methylthioadenosine/S-adenosylhomocysteine deaminase
MKAPSLLLHGGTVVTVDPADRVLAADVLVEGGRIAAIGAGVSHPQDAERIDCTGRLVIPGFVQAHVHLCQTLWRNLADDLSLMDWLRRWTWPMEAAHDGTTLRAAARLGCAELLLSGTTTINDMGTVRHCQAIVDAAAATGIRGVFSKVLMDRHDGPAGLVDDPDRAIEEALAVAAPEGSGGRIATALAPRFAVSSSRGLLERVAAAATATGKLVHTHASENAEENRLTVERFGVRPIDLYGQLGLLGPRLLLAHCVDVTPGEVGTLARTRTAVLHCPTANLKLGSGMAPVPAMLDAGVRVSLGADGAPCNNNLSAFQEMRMAALVQKAGHGPTAMPAARVLRMATAAGADAIGLGAVTGSIEPGKAADLVVLDPRRPWSSPWEEPAAAIVHSMNAANVEHVLVDGRVLVRDGRLVAMDLDDVVREGLEASAALRRRAGQLTV